MSSVCSGERWRKTAGFKMDCEARAGYNVPNLVFFPAPGHRVFLLYVGIVEVRYWDTRTLGQSKSLGTFSKRTLGFLKWRWMPSPHCLPIIPKHAPKWCMQGTVWCSNRCNFGVIVFCCGMVTLSRTRSMKMAILFCSWTRVSPIYVYLFTSRKDTFISLCASCGFIKSG